MMIRTRSAHAFILLVFLFVVQGSVSAAATNAAPTAKVRRSATNDKMRTYSNSELGDLSRVQSAFNESKSFENTVIYKYDRRYIYKVRTRVAMDTLIVLPDLETIQVFNFADTVNFKFVPLKDTTGAWTNKGIIKNLNPGADTNLIVIGKSSNAYNFYVRVDDHTSRYLPHLTVIIEDDTIAGKLGLSIDGPQSPEILIDKDTSSDTGSGSIPSALNGESRGTGDYLREIDNTPMSELRRDQNLDFRYAIYLNDQLISPKVVFDDGYWTYFKLTDAPNLDKIPELPVILQVVNGVEVPVNTRVVNNYIVVEQTGRLFALRVDDRYICVEKLVEHPNRFLR